MIVRAAAPSDVHHVFRYMRAHNRREFFSTRDHCDPDAIADKILWLRNCLGLDALCAETGEAIAIAGAWQTAPGVAAVMFLATEAWPAIALPASRYLKQKFLPRALGGVRRAETSVLAVEQNRAWLAFMGFSIEGTARSRGNRGEDFWHVGWVNPCWRVPATVDGGKPPVASASQITGEPAHV